MMKKYWKYLAGLAVVGGFVALAAPTSSTYLVGQFLRNGAGIITIPVANYWGIAEGGTNYSSETTNGVAYFDGTGINTGTGFVYVGGQVGIGTTPNNILELGSGVIGSISGYKGAISNNSGNSGWDVGQGSSNRGHMTWLYNATAASAYMAVGTHSGSNYLILNDEGGDVGINTTTPAYQLDVSGTLHASGNATLSGTGNSVGTITSGSWNGTAIGTGYGGTGVITSSSTGVPVISSGTWLVDSTLPVTLGGTGLATSTSAYAPIVGGTTATGNFQSANTGMQNTGYVLTSTGVNSLPTFQAPGSPTFSGQVQYAIAVALSATTIGSVSSAGTSGQVMTSNGASAYPTMQTVPGNSTVLKAPTIQTFTTQGSTSGYLFTITSNSSAVGCVYTNDGASFTVVQAVTSSTTVFMSSTSASQSSGTLAYSSGGSSCSALGNITFSSYTAYSNYTVPSSPAPLVLDIRLCGAGGGGGGAGSSTDNTGTTGSTTYFDGSIISCTGGVGGTGGNGSAGGNGGSNGTCTVTTSGSVLSLINIAGQAGTAAVGTSLNTELSGNGGDSAFFGGGGTPAAQSAIGSGATTNSGGGGSGGGGISGTTFAGGGGGAAGCVEVHINSPTGGTTFPYILGGGGGGGSGSSKNGGAGAAGQIIVEERYQ